MAVDTSDMRSHLSGFSKQCHDALALPGGLRAKQGIRNIVVVGMGGSAIAGDLLATYLYKSIVPVTVVRDYHIPGFVDASTLVFANSYSGDTEETISAAEEARERGASIFAITSGGKLGSMDMRTIKIPSGLPPRTALGYLFFPMLGILNNGEITSVSNSELKELFAKISEAAKFEEAGRELSKRLRGGVPLIYTSERLRCVGYRFKCQINENAKLVAFCHTLPEMNHNEILGFHAARKGDYVVLLIRDADDDKRVLKRMDICKELLRHKLDVVEIQTQGKGLLARLFSAIYTMDWASYHLALFNRTDPTPVEMIEEIKQRMSR